MVSGYGTTEIRANRAGKDGMLPAMLQYTHVRLLDRKQCEADLGRLLGKEDARELLGTDAALWWARRALWSCAIWLRGAGLGGAADGFLDRPAIADGPD